MKNVNVQVLCGLYMSVRRLRLDKSNLTAQAPDRMIRSSCDSPDI